MCTHNIQRLELKNTEPKMEKVEEKIREKLARRLDLFDDGLELLGQEAFLPNKKGTRGFVDILASDSHRRFVLIELKRSKAASREAIHEVFKYIEGVKENKSLKNDEIVAYIVSTEWDELLIPFSSLVSQAEYEVKGFSLSVDGELNPIAIVPVTPLTIENERFIADQHAICLYTDENSLKRGVKSHADCFRKKGITDYVLLVLRAHPEFHECNLRATARGLEDIASQFGGEPSKTYDDLKEIMPEYGYMIYSAAQVMNENRYWQIITNDQDQYNEMLEIAENMDSEELLHTLHEYAVENTEPRPYQEHYDIGYPAKLRTKILENEGWTIIEVIRNGKLKENELLTDDAIVNELAGDSGTNKQVYSKNFSSNNKASLDQIVKEVNKCLVENEIWLAGIEKAINEIAKQSRKEEYQGRIHIFNPSNTLLSLFLSATSPSPEEAMRWIPSYYINIDYNSARTAYFGCLIRNGIKSDLQSVFDKVYDGSASQLLMSLTWGGYQSNDIDICPLYGLEYANYKCEIDGEDRIFYRFDGYRYKPCEKTDPYCEYFAFMNENSGFIDEVVEVFESATLTSGIAQF